ncbi:MAG: biopolymer transporter ExbD [Gammaproteobacteria bacterium]|nr:biopolymer transporter ExbD [Gammaproteobacteria bacterium]MDD9824245.1 biopolymer transporter ExbD [Gammaproteobacteria bacterium]
MNFRSRSAESVDINLTPLIDIVFLLLIFFMVSTSFQRESEIEITLPQAGPELLEVQPETIEIAVDADDRIYVNQVQIVNSSTRTVREALQELTLEAEDPTLVVNADARATHQAVIRVMDAARQLGLQRITFATRFEESR